MKNKKEFIESKLNDLSLEELFELLDQEPVEVILLLDNLGFINIDYLLQDEEWDSLENNE